VSRDGDAPQSELLALADRTTPLDCQQDMLADCVATVFILWQLLPLHLTLWTQLDQFKLQGGVFVSTQVP